ncbi:hypothetical protein [Treponema parvum]|uniref:hypothetical protein n=1 Tax=Treponema parvum TaxID=138851 RepID=UPI001AEC3ED6|nr:hypothetical protein [Treponema parvum]QTQ15441.1 hypothetical protein HXT04_01255 [Treponema parvum]
MYAPKTEPLSIRAYHRILSPESPDFIDDYIRLPILQRLSGVGLLCGTDWTPLYRNRFYYSRLDHSVGVALILWHFTHDKIQTLAGLLHDVSTPAFSHVADFRNGDALTQESTESINAEMIKSDKELCGRLHADGIPPDSVADYHIYPLADNKLPRLSADRLEYMFPSGAALEGSWNLFEIAKTYNDIVPCVNEDGEAELGFKTKEIAETYCKKFCRTGHLLQLNENKLALQLLAKIVDEAIEIGLLKESDCYEKTEREIILRLDSCLDPGLDSYAKKNAGQPPQFAADKTLHAAFIREAGDFSHRFSRMEEFMKLHRTFRKMTRIKHTEKELPNHFCVSLDVKKRYIDPLVLCSGSGTGGMCSAKRLSCVSKKSAKLIEDFLLWRDTKYGCVKYV